MGQLVKWKDLENWYCRSTEINDTPMLTRIQLINKITDLSDGLRLDFYTSKLRSKITDRFEVNSLNIALEAYDHALLGQISSNAEHHNMKFVELFSYLKKIIFPFFLYSTIYWERKRKDILGPLLTEVLISQLSLMWDLF